MQNSGISSQEGQSPSLSPGKPTPTRKRFALTGRSAQIDPRIDAVRPDLADIRLADRVFAPHYAAPMPRALAQDAALRLAADAGSEVVAELKAGDRFEVLELTGSNAWGVAPGAGRVGYIPAAALGTAA